MRSQSRLLPLLACAALLALLPPAPAIPKQMLPRPRPPAPANGVGVDTLPDHAALPPAFRELAKRSGEPQVPGLNIVYLHPLGSPAEASRWRNIIVHQTEGPAGSAKAMAQGQAKDPTKRGVMIWVETDGTVYWSTAETVIPTHGDGAKPATREQVQAWLTLVRFLQERYDIAPENVYAHNWIDFKDRRYCEGCELATLARKLAYEPGKQAGKEP